MNKPETARKLLTVIIFALLAALLVLLISLITRGTCSNAVGNGILPTNTPAGTIVDVNTPDAAENSSSPIFTDALGTDPTPFESVSPQSVPLAVTTGTLEETLARLELLKTLPSTETIILLDVGHGGFDGGAIGTTTGTAEAELNLLVSRLLAQRLAEKGYYVFMTRMGDYAVANNKDADMQLRREIMKLDIFDLSVSIHMNSFVSDRSVKGARVYCYEHGTEGEKLAECLLKAICEQTEQRNRGITVDDLMVVREPVAPAALVECGFLTNAEEEKKLIDPSYQALLAKAIADGIEVYLNGAVS